MSETQNDKHYVFGLDIGTRNVVGTVGYREGKEFHVLAQYMVEHDTRAMLDGQIHDIGRVGDTIRSVKEELEKQTNVTLTDVCIAAAGRVLKTVTTNVEYEFEEETFVTGEHVHTLDLLGVDQAQTILTEKNDTKYKFYVVGYTTVKYYLNDEIFSNLVNHKAEKIGEEIIVTFLPEDVVDGLYSAVGLAGLEVANLTLEPIAAINIAIPESFRMLNIALVDVGAGTSDISITRDGSIIAYGMIPLAGDELTEVIVQSYLVDFNTAEQIKRDSGEAEEITYQDIMGISHTVTAEEVWKLLEPVVEKITSDVSGKIKELNGDRAVSATFVVGGGGKIHGFCESIAEKLELPRERVALRGEEVLRQVIFEQKNVVKDPLLVTPVGICLSFYDEKNSFIMVHFNGERIKLYDNNHLTIVDAALAAGFPNDQLFPRRGREIPFTVNGNARIARGEAGESAVVTLNDRPANINTPILPNCYITITASTVGTDAVLTIEQLPEYTDATIDFIVNKKVVACPRFVEVNGELKPPTYEIRDNDRIETRPYYTVGQLAEFMDMHPDPDTIVVNNREADEDTLIYENFEIEWEEIVDYEEKAARLEKVEAAPAEAKPVEAVQNTIHPAIEIRAAEEPAADSPKETAPAVKEADGAAVPVEANASNAPAAVGPSAAEEKPQIAVPEEPADAQALPITVKVNGEEIVLDQKQDYVFVDIFDVIDFDLSDSRGRAIVTLVNKEHVPYSQKLKDGDEIDIYWKEN